MASLILPRGCVFAAEHDPSYGPAWVSQESEWKKCLAFNITPVQTDSEDVQYFLATAEVWRFRENPQLLSEVHFVPGGKYPFFSKETAIEFSDLWIVPLAKLMGHRAKVQGQLLPEDLNQCIEVARKARLLSTKMKRTLGLLPPKPA